jgi:cytosine/adenosine deaminase-related metal-dependent hydrolase
MNRLTLTGDAITPPIPLTEAEVNHLRRLLAWLRCEYTLDPDAQRGYLLGATEAVRQGFTTPARASGLIAERAADINRCPAYVRQAIAMLTKAIRDHERKAGIVDAEPSVPYPEFCRQREKCAGRGFCPLDPTCAD